MKNIFLFIVLIVVGIIVFSRNQEGLQNYSQPIISDSTNPLFSTMLKTDKAEGVTNDLNYFNNATNIIYGYTQIPNV